MYNCEHQITRVLNQFDQKITQYIPEILIVNNRSTDKSEEVAISCALKMTNTKVTVVRNNDNYGLGGSHKVAIDYAQKHNYDHVIVLHGDDQGSIKDLFPYLQSGEYKEYDCFLGARFHKNSNLIGYSKFRTFGNRVYNLLFSIISNHKIYDLGSGLNCYNVNIFKDSFHKKFPDDLTFNYCMILASIYYNHKINFFPLSWREDDQVSNVKMTRQAIKVLNLLFSFAFNKKRFLSSELRSKVIQEYSYDLIFSNKPVELREGNL